MYIYICLYIYIYKCLYVYVYICIYIYLCDCMFVYIYIYIHVYIYICIHIRLYTYLYISNIYTNFSPLQYEAVIGHHQNLVPFLGYQIHPIYQKTWFSSNTTARLQNQVPHCSLKRFEVRWSNSGDGVRDTSTGKAKRGGLG